MESRKLHVYPSNSNLALLLQLCRVYIILQTHACPLVCFTCATGVTMVRSCSHQDETHSALVLVCRLVTGVTVQVPLEVS